MPINYLMEILEILAEYIVEVPKREKMRFKPENSLLDHLRRRPAAIDQNICLLIVEFERSLLRQVSYDRLVNGKTAASGAVTTGGNECWTLFLAWQNQ